MKQLLLFISIFIFLLPGCLRHEYKKPISNGYVLYAYAHNEDMTIIRADKYGSFEVIEPVIFAVGYDKDFIIAKQHPAIYPEKENKNITNYFIISLKQPVSWTERDVAIGPLNENQFMDMRKKLNVADSLAFTIMFDGSD